MRIYVGGSLSRVQRYGDLCPHFVEKLGEEIVERGHTLLTGCRGSLDEKIAGAAHRRLLQRAETQPDGAAPRRCRQLVSYILEGDENVHERFDFELTQSTRSSWELTQPDLDPPEQIANADVAIFVAGGEGTLLAANWARIAGTPILGVAQFGGAGQQIFAKEKSRYFESYAHLVAEHEFDLLRQVTTHGTSLARDVVTLCEAVITPNRVFPALSFKKDYREVLKSYKKVCAAHGFRVKRTGESKTGERIIPEIMRRIRGSSFVIADVSEPSSNVFYEIGLAEGLGLPIIFTARKGTALPFDIADIPVEFWSNQKDLRQKLERRVQDIEMIVRKL